MLDRQPVLEDGHVRLRPLRPDDWEALYAVAADPLVRQQHPAHDRWQESVFRAFFDDALANRGALIVLDAQSGAVIGSSRFQGLEEAPEEGGVGSVEIGWTFLARSHWGGVYNHAMKRLMLAHALASVAEVRFMVGATNTRTLEKIGAVLTDRREERIMAGGERIAHLTYVITREGFETGPLAG